jgi:hypothetical protein
MKYIISLVLIIAIVLLFFINSNIESGSRQASHELQFSFSQEATNVKKLKNMGDYNAIVERPLFIEDRQFVEVKKVKVAPKKRPVIDDLKVKALGIALTGDGILAVLKDLKNGNNLRLRIGEEIYGWRLDSVSESSFTFSKAGKEKVVAFKD